LSLKRAAAVLIAMMALAMSGSALRACDVLRVNGVYDWYPVFMRDRTFGPADGILPVVVEEAARRLGIEIEYQNDTPYKRQLAMLKSGDLDAILGAYWTADRARHYSYSIPIFEDEVAVFVLEAKAFPFADWDDLKGRHGARPFGGSYGDAFDTFSKDQLTMQLIEPSRNNNLLRMLADNRFDYLILGRYHGLKLKNLDGLSSVVDLPNPLLSNDVHIIFSKTSRCAGRVPEFLAQLQELKENGFVGAAARPYRF